MNRGTIDLAARIPANDTPERGAEARGSGFANIVNDNRPPIWRRRGARWAALMAAALLIAAAGVYYLGS